MKWLCWLGIHDWEYSKVFRKTMNWMVGHKVDTIEKYNVQSKTCKKCGRIKNNKGITDMKSPNEIIIQFLDENTEFKEVQFDPENRDLTVYFYNSKEPWSVGEFTEGSETKNKLNRLWDRLSRSYFCLE